MKLRTLQIRNSKSHGNMWRYLLDAHRATIMVTNPDLLSSESFVGSFLNSKGMSKAGTSKVRGGE